jgi:hypothetical protein
MGLLEKFTTSPEHFIELGKLKKTFLTAEWCRVITEVLCLKKNIS